MFTTLQTTLKRASRWLPVLLLPLAAQSQTLSYPAASAANVAGTYTDLGTNGTAITVVNPDDANSAAQPIGFTFNYNGAAFTQFVLNTNGVFKLGNTPPSTAALYYENFAGGSGVDPLSPAAVAANVNLVMPFNIDLEEGTGGTADFRVQTTGTAPNQVCTIQWKNLKDKAEPGTGAPVQFNNFSFQAKLYQNGNIEFVYGPVVASTNPTDVRFPNVGLKGSGVAINQVALALKTAPASAWSTTTFINQNYGANAHDIDKVGLPDLGRTYRFVPGAPTAGPANDECVNATALTVTATCTPTNGTVANATQSRAPILCGGFTAGQARDVWYSFVATGTIQTVAVTGTFDGVLEVFSGTCTTPVNVGCADASGNNETLTLSTLTAGTTYLMRYYAYDAVPAGSTFSICVTAPSGNDAAVSAVYTLGQISTFASPHAVQAVVRNTGGTSQSNLVVTLNVTGANPFTATQTVASLATGASATVTFPAYPIANLGTNTVTVSIPADGDNTNNSVAETQVVTAGGLSYVAPNVTTFAGGLGAGANSQLYVKYTVTNPTTLISITPTFNGPGAANDYQVQVYSASGTGGTPGTLLYTSPTRTRPAAGGPDVVNGISVPVSGSFYVATKQLAAANIGLAYAAEAPLRPGTFYFSANGTAFTDLSTSTFPARLAIGVTLGTPPACAPVSGLAVGSITSTGASVTFTGPSNGTTYTVTYTPTGGTATTVTPAPTGSPVVLSGLTGGTTYTVSVTANCGPGQTSTATTTTFMTLIVNDNPAGAIDLPISATCVPINATNVGATTTTPNGYVNPGSGCGIAVNPRDVWFKLTTNATGLASTGITITVGGTPAGLVRLFSSASGAAGPFTQLGCSAGTGTNTQAPPLIVGGLTPSTTYYVFVSGYSSTDAQGSFTICATVPPACGNPANLVVSGVTGTMATLSFAPGTGNTSYTVTYTPTGGSATTVTPAPTASPVILSNLTPSTTYTISVMGNCANGATTTTLTGTFITPAPNVYATLPYSESFEAAWINSLATRDIPNRSWRNNPATGDNSWRRDDDGGSAAWRFLPTGAYTPAASVGARSARFHSYGTNLGQIGRFDLYANLSTGAVGTRTLSFDYINPTGTDKLDIFVSTDGGVTFGTTPVLTATVNATFAAKTVAIASTSATTVIRFQATSDFGADDLGIDNIQLRVITATRNEVLAATVGLYPNPAHQRFTLAVPAGSLHKASATLVNALGQVVQRRQLSLPAAGGTADFDVSGLAAGVYSLQLKAGDELVVKRVVVE